MPKRKTTSRTFSRATRNTAAPRLRSALLALCLCALPAQTPTPSPTPVTIPLHEERGLIYADVAIGGKIHRFLVDSASQIDVISASLADALALHPEGDVEISGTGRVRGDGMAEVPAMTIGGIDFPPHVAAVMNMPGMVAADGVLGFPFFSRAEVRIDPTRDTMTIAPPGTLGVAGTKLAAAVDRRLPEIAASIQGVQTHLIVDTANTTELLIFRSFVEEHRSAVEVASLGPVLNRGVGGSLAAVATIVGSLRLGPYTLFNRRADVVLDSKGAFADPGVGGNVGFGSLRNFVVTFDLADDAIYLQQAIGFDDGRDRAQSRCAEKIDNLPSTLC